MGTKNNPGDVDYYAKAEDDEPLFVLMARDPMAPYLVRLWAQARLLAATDQYQANRAQHAFDCADDMEVWSAEHPDHGFKGAKR